MPKPNITGLSLAIYLQLRYDQLYARRQSIEVYNSNHLPEWGDKKYTDDDWNQVNADLAECRFLMLALTHFKQDNL